MSERASMNRIRKAEKELRAAYLELGGDRPGVGRRLLTLSEKCEDVRRRLMRGVFRTLDTRK